jgi:hypothetical protein
VVPLAALLAVAVGGLVVGLGRVGVEVVTASRASAAADAAALAGAAEGREAAERLATANGGVLVAYASEGREVQVAVRVGEAEAVARATAVEPPAAVGLGGLTSEMRAALAAAEAALGRAVPVTSGWRSPASQQALWDRRATNPHPVARPGTSAHERGEAIDVDLQVADELARVGESVGLCRPLPATDPVHFELCRVKRAS